MSQRYSMPHDISRMDQVPAKMQMYYLNIPDDTLLKLLPGIWKIILKDYLIFDYNDKKTYYYIGEKLEKIYRTIENNEYYIYQNYIQKCRQCLKFSEIRIQLRHIINQFKIHCVLLKEYNVATFFENKVYRDTWSLYREVDYKAVHNAINCGCIKLQGKKKHHKLCKCIKKRLIDIWTQLCDILYFFRKAVNIPHNGIFLNDYHYNLLAGRTFRISKAIKTIL